jgi:hypothetical protein
MLAIAESGFAMAGEKRGDFCASLGFDHVVGVDEAPAKACGDEGADGGFAGAHEAGEDDAAGCNGPSCGLEVSGQWSLAEAGKRDAMYSV